MNQPWVYTCGPSCHFKDVKINKHKLPQLPFPFVKFSLLFSIFWSLDMAAKMALLIFKISSPYKAHLCNPQLPSFNPEPVSRLSSLCIFASGKFGVCLGCLLAPWALRPSPPSHLRGAQASHLVAQVAFRFYHCVAIHSLWNSFPSVSTLADSPLTSWRNKRRLSWILTG